MKLHRIELCGFKSFVDRTVVHFDPQVTAVVGPNGCGKSNIVDAIRWSMGEQNARFLRGKAMDEVIFSGSETRSPHDFCEVILTFDNSDEAGHPDYAQFAEVAVTRRLDRDGHSEYLINAAPCRLRDVTELLLSSGVSPRSSMVEQGRMGLIVTARPEERRILLEEAAGIAKYRLHRRATQRKMEQVKQNLLRVADVVAEMKRGLNSLQRQVGKAKRFKLYREELTELELRVSSHRYLELSAIASRRNRDLAIVEETLEQVSGAVTEQEAAIARGRAEQQKAEERLDTLQSQSYQASNTVQQTESRIDRLVQQLANESKSEAEARLRALALQRRRGELREEQAEAQDHHQETAAQVERLQEEFALRQERLDTVRQQRLAVERQLDQSRSHVMRASAAIAAGERALQSQEQKRLEGRERAEELGFSQAEAERRVIELESEVEALTEYVGTVRQRAQDIGASREDQEALRHRLEEELGRAQPLLAEVGGELTRCRSRLQSLEEIAGRYENVGQGVRELMRRPESREHVKGVVAEFMEVPSELETALAAVVGEQLQDVVVDSREGAAQALKLISEEQLGRAAVIPQQPRQLAEAVDCPSHEGVVGLLIDQVRYQPHHEQLVRHLLQGVVLVRDVAAALALAAQDTEHCTWVTSQGEVVTPSGRMWAGQEEVSLALLQTKGEIRRLREQANRLDASHEEKAARVAELRAQLADVTRRLDELRHDAHQRDLELVQQQKDLSRTEDELRRQRAEVDRLGEEALRLADSAEDCLLEADRIRLEVTTASQEKNDAQRVLDEGQQRLDEWRSEEEEAMSAATELRVQAAGATERMEALQRTMDRLRHEADDVRVRLRRLGEDQLRSARAQGELGGELFAARERLVDLAEKARLLRLSVEDAKSDLDDLRVTLSQNEAAIRGIRQERDQRREQAERLRLDLHDVLLERKGLLTRVEEARGIDLEEVIVDFHRLPPAQEAQVERIDELRRAIDRIGPVNLTAVEEYDELKVRYEESEAQQQDLEQSLNHLQRAIQKLNREGRKRFRETFDAVNSHFQKFFPRLFEGGRAHLVLTDESDLLETGVDIVAQPPGKKLGRMELMSGGEKSMTAVSLIFALFKASPSPFTILDEVDAPFDDANVRRYLEVLREMADDSQFVLVTHSKLSMAQSDVLYGVTMEEAGVSKIVSVRLRDRDHHRDAAAAA
jgi:chromosome segregation protein